MEKLSLLLLLPSTILVTNAKTLLLPSSETERNLSAFFDEMFADKYCIHVLGEINSSSSKALMDLKAVVVLNEVSFVCTATGYLIGAYKEWKLHNFVPKTRIFLMLDDKIDANLIGNQIVTIRDDKVIDLYTNEEYDSDWELDLKLRKFRISLFNCPPYLKYDVNKGVYGGIEKFILEEIMKDWDVDLIPRKKYSWGSVLDDVRLKRSDLATCGHWMWRVTQLNIEAVPYMQGCATYLVPKPTLIATTIFDPFSLCTWILIAVLTQIVSFILYLTQKYIVGINRNYSYSFLEVFRILALNPMTNFPSHRNLKFILVLWYLTALQLSIAFSAGFTSTLTHEKYTNPIDNIRDIVFNDVACYDVGTSLSSWLKYSDNVFVKMLSQSIIANHTMENLPDDACLGANVIRNYVVPEISDIREDIKDKIKLISECVGEFYLTLALQKNSPYSEFINRKITMFQEHGLIEAWFMNAIYEDFNYWQNMSQYITPRTSIMGKKLNYDQLDGAFYALFIGLLAAFATFIIESFN